MRDIFALTLVLCGVLLSGCGDESEDTESGPVGIIKNFLLLDPTRIRPKQLDTAAFVIYQSVRATMLAYLLESPAGVDDAVLVSEITELIVGYLVGRE